MKFAAMTIRTYASDHGTPKTRGSIRFPRRVNAGAINSAVDSENQPTATRDQRRGIPVQARCSRKNASVRSHANFAASATYASGREPLKNAWPAS